MFSNSFSQNYVWKLKTIIWTFLPFFGAMEIFLGFVDLKPKCAIRKQLNSLTADNLSPHTNTTSPNYTTKKTDPIGPWYTKSLSAQNWRTRLSYPISLLFLYVCNLDLTFLYLNLHLLISFWVGADFDLVRIAINLRKETNCLLFFPLSCAVIAYWMGRVWVSGFFLFFGENYLSGFFLSIVLCSYSEVESRVRGQHLYNWSRLSFLCFPRRIC